jgi:hypothetical protein
VLGVVGIGVAVGGGVTAGGTLTSTLGTTGAGTLTSTLGAACGGAGVTSFVVVLFRSITVDLLSLIVLVPLGTKIGVVGRLLKKYILAPIPTAKVRTIPSINPVALLSLLTRAISF